MEQRFSRSFELYKKGQRDPILLTIMLILVIYKLVIPKQLTFLSNSEVEYGDIFLYIVALLGTIHQRHRAENWNPTYK